MNVFSVTKEEGEIYLEKEDVLRYLANGAGEQLKPDYADLARLHQLIRSRRAFTVLEFGIGWSTLVIADALKKNREEWDTCEERPNTRNETPFKLFSVDAEEQWIGVTNDLLPEELKEYVETVHAPVKAGTFNDRMCHFYEHLPDVVPDFIYLDGPHPLSVQGSLSGMSWQSPDRTVLAGDILTMEPTLLPGTFILTDGRTNNARFLNNNFQRSWVMNHYPEEDVSTLELVEPPLGSINRETLRYCLLPDAYKQYQ